MSEAKTEPKQTRPEDRRIDTSQPEPSPDDLKQQVQRLQSENNYLRETMQVAERAQKRALTIPDPRTIDRAELETAVQVSTKYQQYGKEVQQYVIAVALATGLHPEFEMHAFPIRGKLTMFPDYKGVIRRVREQYPLAMYKTRQLTPDEMRERRIPEKDIKDGSIAIECSIVVPVDGKPWEIAKAVAWAEAKTWDKKARKYKDADVPYARDLYWVAEKRAKRAASYDLGPLGLNVGAPVQGVELQGDDEYLIDLPDDDEQAPTVVEGQFAPREAPEQPQPDNGAASKPDDDKSFKAVIANWTGSDWNKYWAYIKDFMTASEWHAQLGRDSVKAFEGTKAQHDQLVLDAIKAKKQGRDLPTDKAKQLHAQLAAQDEPEGNEPPAAKDEPEQGGEGQGRISIDDAEGSTVIASAWVRAIKGQKPELTIYGLDADGNADQLPLIAGRYGADDIRAWFPNTPTPLPEEETEVYTHDPSTGVVVIAHWAQSPEGNNLQLADVTWE